MGQDQDPIGPEQQDAVTVNAVEAGPGFPSLRGNTPGTPVPGTNHFFLSSKGGTP